MNRPRQLIPAFLLCLMMGGAAYCQDTLIGENGQWFVGRLNKRDQQVGKWITYDTGGLVCIERFKLGYLHGLSSDCREKTKVRYRYGFSRDELWTEEGKKLVFYFTAGMPAFPFCPFHEEKFACVITPIAGCVISPGTVIRLRLHNFFVGMRQSFRFGLKWRDTFWNGKCTQPDHS